MTILYLVGSSWGSFGWYYIGTTSETFSQWRMFLDYVNKSERYWMSQNEHLRAMSENLKSRTWIVPQYHPEVCTKPKKVHIYVFGIIQKIRFIVMLGCNGDIVVIVALYIVVSLEGILEFFSPFLLACMMFINRTSRDDFKL